MYDLDVVGLRAGLDLARALGLEHLRETEL
jgi:hypothetical protein